MTVGDLTFEEQPLVTLLLVYDEVTKQSERYDERLPS